MEKSSSRITSHQLQNGNFSTDKIQNRNWIDDNNEALKRNAREYRGKLKKMRIQETCIQNSENSVVISAPNETIKPQECSILDENINEDLIIDSINSFKLFSETVEDRLIGEDGFDKNELEPIYVDFNINVKQFCLSFVLCCQRLKLSLKGREILLDYLKAIILNPNKIPTSYNKIIKNIKVKPVNEIKICVYCNKEFDKQKCFDPDCFSNNQISQAQESKSVFVFDTKEQISNVVKYEWSNFNSYKGDFK